MRQLNAAISALDYHPTSILRWMMWTICGMRGKIVWIPLTEDAPTSNRVGMPNMDGSIGRHQAHPLPHSKPKSAHGYDNSWFGR